MQITVNTWARVQGVGRGKKTRQDNLTNAYLSHANWHARIKKGAHLINWHGGGWKWIRSTQSGERKKTTGGGVGGQQRQRQKKFSETTLHLSLFFSLKTLRDSKSWKTHLKKPQPHKFNDTDIYFPDIYYSTTNPYQIILKVTSELTKTKQTQRRDFLVYAFLCSIEKLMAK